MCVRRVAGCVQMSVQRVVVVWCYGKHVKFTALFRNGTKQQAAGHGHGQGAAQRVRGVRADVRNILAHAW